MCRATVLSMYPEKVVGSHKYLPSIYPSKYLSHYRGMQAFVTNNIYIDVCASIIPYISKETVSCLKPRIVS
jgi:hypothetical protein